MNELAKRLTSAESQLAVVVDLMRCHEDLGLDQELTRGLSSILENVLETVKAAVDFTTMNKQ